MSPARGRTSAAEIVAAGRDLLEAGGLDALTMQAVAGRVGVRAPSLYKRFPNRGALVAAVISLILVELGESIEAAADERDPVAGLRAMAARYRAYALAHPRAYALAFMDLPADHRPPADETARAAAPLLAVTARIVGPAQTLEAARLVTAFVHGFISMELAGAFRLGGDVGTAYDYGVQVISAALAKGQLPEESALDLE